LKELKEGGLDQNIIANFQSYGNDKLTPKFNEEYKTKNKDNKEIIIPAYSEVTFSFQRGDDTRSGNIKISKGEESLFIWSLFYTLLKHLNELEPDERETSEFNLLEYVFIDDPVSSLDENHLIELAVSLADLIKRSGSKIKFIITTHNPLFYNVLYNEFSQKTGYLLNALEDGTFTLIEKQGDSNQSFSYHLYLKQVLEEAIENNQVQKYHFTLLRNLYEKTATFLGYPRWSELLPDDKRLYYNRIIQFTSHSTLSNEEVAEPTPQEKQTVKLLLNHLLENSVYNSKGTQNA
jgi:wobble nucleotide-excising tRNase